MTSDRINRIIVAVALILSAINVVLLVSLLDVRSKIADAARQASSMLKEAQSQSLAVPLTANVAINDTFSVPIKTVVPINTTVNVPVEIPLTGQIVNVTVPINAQVPIDTVIKVPIRTTIPVNIKVSSSPFGDILRQLDSWLAKLAGGL